MLTRRILVTGAGGQLGKTIQELYANNSLDLEFTFATKAELDITKPKHLANFFSENNFDYCINCAAYTNVEQAEKTPKIAYKINAEGVKYLAEFCKTNSMVLIHVSTDYVFDGEKTEPYTIEDIPNPINEYGRSKLKGERYIQEVLDKYFIIRTSWLYSKKYGHNFYKSIIKWAKAGRDLKITTEQTGCPTDTANLSEFIACLITENKKNYGICHYSDKEIMTWYDFGRKILEENKLIEETKLNKIENYNTFTKRPKFSVLI